MMPTAGEFVAMADLRAELAAARARIAAVDAFDPREEARDFFLSEDTSTDALERLLRRACGR